MCCKCVMFFSDTQVSNLIVFKENFIETGKPKI